jgi:hypothetical protein
MVVGKCHLCCGLLLSGVTWKLSQALLNFRPPWCTWAHRRCCSCRGEGPDEAELLPAAATTQPSRPRARLPPPKDGQKITVLSIDGGGIRGLIPAVILASLEEKLKVIISPVLISLSY